MRHRDNSDRVAIWVLTCLAIASVMLAGRSTFIVSRWFQNLLGTVALISLLFTSLLLRRISRAIKVLLLLAATLAALSCFRLTSIVARLTSLAWLLLAFGWLETRITGWKMTEFEQPVYLSLGVSCLGLAAFVFVYQSSATFWHAFTRIIGALPSPGSPLGLWVSGFPVYLVGLLVAIVSGITGGSAGRKALAVSGGMITSFVAAASIFSCCYPITAWKVTVFHLVSIGLVSAILHPLDKRLELKARHLMVLIAVSLGLLVPAKWSDLPGKAGPPKTRFSAAIYSKGFLDREVPDFDSFGLVSSGLFGLFARSLERHADAHDGEVIYIDSLVLQDMAAANLVIFINPTRNPAQPEVSALNDFVKMGGAVLVLGDHTDIMGTQEPLNRILSPTSVRFNFDSAVPLRKEWHGCLEIREHPVTGWISHDEFSGLAVGASLHIREPAFPLIVGRYGFSDAGDRANTGRGAFMGNVVHNADELAGDVVLVAGEQVGEGRVLVFGDTSPFQNGALFRSQRFVSNSIAWLTGTASNTKRAVTGLVEFRPFEELAIVDFSLAPRASLRLSDDNSLGGLANTLARTRITAAPVLQSHEWQEDASYMVLVSPAKGPDTGETEWLAAYVRRGGNLIVCQGYDHDIACKDLLDHFGFALRPIPLGSGDDQDTVKHEDAWASFYSGQADTVVLATAFGHPTITVLESGLGSFTLISDGGFFLNCNLEGETTAYPQNVVFVGELFKGLRKRFPYELDRET